MQQTDTVDRAQAHELLTKVEGIGSERANQLLNRFGSGYKVARRASSGWGAIRDMDGFSEEMAKTLFHRMRDAGVYEKLKQCH